ncbi:protein adenylyltransferase SelO [Algibacillus agarilyticus]|uniref:protein adenylyltransferase SelO n=1 Tax=Algibacillus agarilyticus TaxID=2234133 RepID=UPI000DCFCEA4|nr:protein adenylyltransferase SelO family protein [Algibacillus agarilyticus]
MNDKISNIAALAKLTDYSLLDTLTADPDATKTGQDHQPREVFSGHYVPVLPTPLAEPEYISHSYVLFDELGFDDKLALDPHFIQLFSGDVSALPSPMRQMGWATGYALSIYGTEYTQQCPFRTGNGYGDGRAISVLELVSNNKRWEMQLKGAGRTPYCRGGDGRAVLRSSVREFLAQEHMHALGIATSRSLSLYVSKTEQVDRPWYYEDSRSHDPETMVSNPVAISTRVAPSFLRVGQLELFARRARTEEHEKALDELQLIVEHLILREYPQIDPQLPMAEKILLLAAEFRERLTSMVAHWLRVGFCQGNFNSDNCAAGGYTLDYGPFGFCELFEPMFQPWTGGGRHFSFLNQPFAAEANFKMFCASLEHLLPSQSDALEKLADIRDSFKPVMQHQLEKMWAAKLGLSAYNSDLLIDLLQLMANTKVDFTMFFRELSHVPQHVSDLEKSFYLATSDELKQQWQTWLNTWRTLVNADSNRAKISEQMKQVNPKYTWREWLVVPAYQQAAQGNYELIKELQQVLNNPYEEQSQEIENKYYQLRPQAFFGIGGVSHYSCSS